MADLNCAACEALREEVPSLVANGFDNSMCTSLKNDTGLKPSANHNDCTDLNNLNDCLVGNMETEVDKYDVCDWKEFIKDLINNLWTTNKAVICAVCGLWTNVHNLWTYAKSYRLQRNGDYIELQANDGLHGRVLVAGEDHDTWQPNTKNQEGYVAKGSGNSNKVWATDKNGNPGWRSKDVIDGKAFIRYYRDLGAGDDVDYWNNISDGFSRTLNIYMDSHGSSAGTKKADRDYVVIISNCTNYRYFRKIEGRVTYFSSGDDRDIATIRRHQGQHPSITQPTGEYLTNFSWTNSGAVLLKAGEHIKVNFYANEVDKGADSHAEGPSVRLHQFVLIWVPVSVDAVSPD